MKQYLLGVQHAWDRPHPAEAEMQAAFAAVDAVNKEMQQTGTWVFGGGLLPPDSSTVVRVADGRTTLTDGPFAETKEQLGGFWVIRANDLDEALKWAEKCATACRETIEVRPFQDEPEA